MRWTGIKREGDDDGDDDGDNDDDDDENERGRVIYSTGGF